MSDTDVDSRRNAVRSAGASVQVSAIRRLMFVALGAGSLAVVAFLAAPAPRGPDEASSFAAADLPKSYAPLGEFALTERTGRQVTRDDLLGKVTVVGFVFTCCHQTCPMVSGVMNRLRSELPTETRLISISVDPVTDTPEVLTEYAAKLSQATEENWWFLTGDRDEIHDLLRHGFRVGVMEDPDAEARGGERITHTTRLALLDRGANVRGYFDSADPAAMGVLKLRVKSLLREAP